MSDGTVENYVNALLELRKANLLELRNRQITQVGHPSESVIMMMLEDILPADKVALILLALEEHKNDDPPLVRPKNRKKMTRKK